MKIDLSHDSSGADDIRADERDDPPAPRDPDSVHVGGWLRDAAGGGIFLGSASCNNAGHDNSGSRCQTPCCREGSDKRAGKRRRNWQFALILHTSCVPTNPVWSSGKQLTCQLSRFSLVPSWSQDKTPHAQQVCIKSQVVIGKTPQPHAICRHGTTFREIPSLQAMIALH